MPKLETIEDFYKEMIGWMPESLRHEFGHFNVFKSDPYVGKSPKPAPLSGTACAFQRKLIPWLR